MKRQPSHVSEAIGIVIMPILAGILAGPTLSELPAWAVQLVLVIYFLGLSVVCHIWKYNLWRPKGWPKV